MVRNVIVFGVMSYVGRSLDVVICVLVFVENFVWSCVEFVIKMKLFGCILELSKIKM